MSTDVDDFSRSGISHRKKTFNKFGGSRHDPINTGKFNFRWSVLIYNTDLLVMVMLVLIAKKISTYWVEHFQTGSRITSPIILPWFGLLHYEAYFIFRRESYNTVSSWLSDARALASPNIVIVLVGNKSDLEAEREVTFLEASRFAQENGE